MSKKTKIALISTGSAFGLLLVLFLLFQFLVWDPNADTYYYEAGYDATLSPSDFLNGPNFLANLSTMDTDGFDPYRIGTYHVTMRHGFFKYQVEVVVEDTEAPEITPSADPIYIKVGEPVSAWDLGADATDKGSAVSMTVNGQDTITEDAIGAYTLTLCATDEYDNSTTAEITVNFDTAPVLSGFEDYYVVPNTQVDYLAGITATDDVDGDLTTSIVCESDDVDLSTAGTYSYTISCTDQYGLTTEQMIAVNVSSSPEIQTLINTHAINRNTQHIVGAINLYDGGYFEDDNIDARLDYYEPAFVAVTEKMSDSFSSRGSGFIVQITDDTIYIVTNNHVASYNANYSAEFYDGTKVAASVLNRTGQVCTANDLAILTVKISDVPADLLDDLMTVHIDTTAYDGLAEDGSVALGLYTIKDSLGLRGYKKYYGALQQKVEHDECTKYSLPQISGCSGSAVIDGHGNLVAVAVLNYYSADGGTAYYGVPLYSLLSYYQSVTGVALNY